jgi:peptide/nickel transport system permease protein
MFKYRILLRLLQLLVTVWGAVTVVFFASRLIPADPARILAGPGANEAAVEAVEERYGLDKPLHLQYARYLGNLLRGDLGRSVMSGREVAGELGRRAPASVELVGAAVGLTLIVSLVLALPAARRPGGLFDRFSDTLVYITTALPPFLIGVILLFLFYTLLRIAPAPLGRISPLIDFETRTGFLVLDGILAGRFDVVRSALAHLLLPTAALSFSLLPQMTRVIKENARRALGHPATRAAVKAGIRGRVFWGRYVVSMTAVPVINLAAGSFGYLIGGAVIVEAVFGWNGLGSYLVNAVNAGDYPVIQGTVLIASSVYAAVYFTSDIASWLIDPRILEERYG